MSTELIKLVETLEKENKKLKEQLEKATAFEFGDKAKQSVFQVKKKGKCWIVADQYGHVLNKRNVFERPDLAKPNEFSLDDALKRAKEEAEKKEKKA
jgi:hypothetical protein